MRLRRHEDAIRSQRYNVFQCILIYAIKDLGEFGPGKSLFECPSSGVGKSLAKRSILDQYDDPLRKRIMITRRREPCVRLMYDVFENAIAT
jgi:hypothetical protein